MTVTDTILLVREAKTCSYVLVIHTPRLCGQPGFKSPLETRDEAYIRCREIVESTDATAQVGGPLTESDFPNKISQRKPLLTVPAQQPPAEPKAADSAVTKDKSNERLRKAIEAILGHKDHDGEPQVIVEQIDLGGDGTEDMVFEIAIDERAFDGHPEQRADASVAHRSLLEMLRAAGVDVKGERDADEKKGKKKEEKPTDAAQGRDEL